jgi:signal transduction histidine kinase
VFLLVMYLCGMAGFLAVLPAGAVALPVLWATGALAAVERPDTGVAHGLLVCAYMSIAWLGGVLVRRPIVQARDARARAAHLEQERELAAQRAVHEERQRIARELHDVIAHSVSVMTVQVGGVRRLLAPGQERERHALLSVEQTGRDALAEMRRLVGLLKEDDAEPHYAPQPGMQSLDALVGTVREAGLAVDVAVEGERRELPPGVDLAAYRVVQEALTNALKHAAPPRASLHIRWDEDQLRIEVANDAVERPGGPGVGHGSAGMRERVTLYGGQLDSGPVAGGYCVRASLPIGREP